MLPTVVRNLFSKSATRLYPYEKRDAMPQSRGQLEVNIDDCVYCGACARVCPSQCLTVDKKQARVEADTFACVFCGICVEACTTGCIKMDPQWLAPSYGRKTLILQGQPKSKEEIQRLTKKRKQEAKG